LNSQARSNIPDWPLIAAIEIIEVRYRKKAAADNSRAQS
jgi:hypothetical protein